MTRTVTLGDQVFSLFGDQPRVGEVIPLPGDGNRVFYVAPTLERWPEAAAREFSEAVRQFGNAPDLLVCSADYEPIVEAWAARAGWRALRFDEALIKSLGLWVAVVSLPAKAVMVVDASSRLQFCEITPRLEDEVAFGEALSALHTLIRRGL